MLTRTKTDAIDLPTAAETIGQMRKLYAEHDFVTLAQVNEAAATMAIYDNAEDVIGDLLGVDFADVQDHVKYALAEQLAEYALDACLEPVKLPDPASLEPVEEFALDCLAEQPAGRWTLSLED